MKKHTQYFILIGIISLALGIGVGLLIKKGMNKDDTATTTEAAGIPAIDHDKTREE